MQNSAPPYLDTTLFLTSLGLRASGEHHTGRHLTVLCTITDEDRSCRTCGQRGLVRSTRIGKLIHPPIGLSNGQIPTALLMKGQFKLCRVVDWRHILTNS